MNKTQTWHDKQLQDATLGQKWADKVANGIGSWRFIILQTLFVVCWMLLNVIGMIKHWDSYPFILLNLLFSTQAAYAAPIIMMSQNRQNERDRAQAIDDYRTNIEAKLEIEALQKQLAKIEVDKLDKIISMLEEMKKKN